MNQPVYDEPSQVDALEGVVLVSGPGGVVVSFTPDAAADTSDRLLHAAAEAQGQRIEMREKAAR